MLRTVFKSALRPYEMKALFKLKIKGNDFAPPKEPLELLAKKLDDKAFCYAALGKVSRSFSFVIQRLPDDLKDAIAIFYLILRALDTIEDDMSFPEKKKLPLLKSFYREGLKEDFSLSGVGDHEDDRILLENFQKVVRAYQTLMPGSQKTIKEITRLMGEGMAKFSGKQIETCNDFDLYCHYVAGLVGIGLSEIFITSGYEKLPVENRNEISNSMGLFLQKTNIIRDYHEDLHSDRTFWPKEIWGNYAGNLEYFSENAKKPESIECLNHMISDALQHIPHCLTYLNAIENPQVLHFTGIPQIMAIVTLAKMFNNSKVFTGNVKIRKGLAVKLMSNDITHQEINEYFIKYLNRIERKCRRSTPYGSEIKKQIQEIKAELKQINVAVTA